jgi:hypothetical protein
MYAGLGTGLQVLEAVAHLVLWYYEYTYVEKVSVSEGFTGIRYSCGGEVANMGNTR